ncbi:MAG: hypothetical protein FJ149_06240 [Euryarchaeota archaeon]|nr:hypothetical protein [Euryarchaeota archaeon]
MGCAIARHIEVRPLGKLHASTVHTVLGWRPALAVIRRESFFPAEAEKTRMNWFCYEISLAIYDQISDQLGERLKGFEIDEKALAEFSVRLARDAKVQIIDWLEGRSKTISYSEEKIGTYLPTLDGGTAKELFNAVLDAWDSLLAICESCPNACITRRDEPAPVFDEEGLGGSSLGTAGGRDTISMGYGRKNRSARSKTMRYPRRSH